MDFASPLTVHLGTYILSSSRSFCCLFVYSGVQLYFRPVPMQSYTLMQLALSIMAHGHYLRNYFITSHCTHVWIQKITDKLNELPYPPYVPNRRSKFCPFSNSRKPKPRADRHIYEIISQGQYGSGSTVGTAALALFLLPPSISPIQVYNLF